VGTAIGTRPDRVGGASRGAQGQALGSGAFQGAYRGGPGARGAGRVPGSADRGRRYAIAVEPKGCKRS
jgi:hypothetical protein